MSKLGGWHKKIGYLNVDRTYRTARLLIMIERLRMLHGRQKSKESPDNTAAYDQKRWGLIISGSGCGAHGRGQVALFFVSLRHWASDTRPCTVRESTKLHRNSDVANVSVVKKCTLCVRVTWWVEVVGATIIQLVIGFCSLSWTRVSISETLFLHDVALFLTFQV